MAMTQSEIIDELSSLVQLDFDAARAYEQAIDEIEVATIRNQLIQYRDDHERHVANLSSIIRKLGGTPPERSRDLKGFLIEGFTAIRSMTGTEGALKAMESNEKTTNKNYNRAAGMDFPSDILAQIEKNYEDEQRHLQYVEQALAGRIWEPSEARYR